jgi:hypothetical protein
MDSRIFRAFPFGDGASNQWVAFLLMLMGTQTQRTEIRNAGVMMLHWRVFTTNRLQITRRDRSVCCIAFGWPAPRKRWLKGTWPI